jgi:hypothetical protein
MRFLCLAVLVAMPWCNAIAAPPQDTGLEQAKRAFEKKMKEIDEEAEQERSKATEKLRKEYADLIAKARKQNDQAAAEHFTKEAVALLGEDGTKGLQGFKQLRKRRPLLKGVPLQQQGDVQIRTEYDKQVPVIDGAPTTEPFLWSPAPSSSTWEIPKGAKTFEVFADNMFVGGVPHNCNCIMEIFIDGKSVAKTSAIGPGSKVEKLIAQIPKGAKVLTLVSDPHQGGTDYDHCVWVEPCFYDR